MNKSKPSLKADGLRKECSHCQKSVKICKCQCAQDKTRYHTTPGKTVKDEEWGEIPKVIKYPKDFNSPEKLDIIMQNQAVINEKLNKILLAKRQRIREKIEGMKKPEATDITKVNLSQLYGYNQAIKDILRALEE